MLPHHSFLVTSYDSFMDVGPTNGTVRTKDRTSGRTPEVLQQPLGRRFLHYLGTEFRFRPEQRRFRNVGQTPPSPGSGQAPRRFIPSGSLVFRTSRVVERRRGRRLLPETPKRIPLLGSQVRITTHECSAMAFPPLASR